MMPAVRDNLRSYAQSVQRPYLKVNAALFVAFVLLATIPLLPVNIVRPRNSLESAVQAYADVLPGQPRSAVDAYGFTCRPRSIYYNAPTQNNCVLDLASGPFASIKLIMSPDDQQVERISFFLRDGSFRVGDWELVLGVQHQESFPKVMFYDWQDYFVAVTTDQVVRSNVYFYAIADITMTRS
ncbi:MAG: hypothetical protein JNJ78_22590 [Anaerolineae bacterium]|nr:hypothetical protein [Anaerolineae bacterium]